MALVPCHYSFQFVVDPDVDGKPKYLNCLVNMRSADVFLGVPFNIASYAFLTHIISHVTGLTPGTVSISMADCHLYTNHVVQSETLISRMPKSFPTINFGPKILDTINPTIDDFAYKFTPEDYLINDYNPYPGIKAQMAV
jgi:thymidylate synthase